MPDALPQGGIPPSAWRYTTPLGRKLFDLYTSLGDVTISAPTQIATVQDGPMRVARYGKLTVNAALTASARCRGLVILCDELVVGAPGSISMSGLGASVPSAVVPEFPIADIVIPDVLTVQSSSRQYADFLRLLRDNGVAPFDRGYFESRNAAGLGIGVTQGTGVVLVTATGCGAGGARKASGGADAQTGNAGTAGTSGGTGGGGGGAAYGVDRYQIGGAGGGGSPYSGGCGGGAGLSGAGGQDTTLSAPVASSLVGAVAPGGLLIIICRGPVTIASGGVISADGTAGGVSGTVGGGGSGGGAVVLIHGGTLTNSGTIRATGGAGGVGSLCNGGAGGNGSVVTKTFAQMGAAWA
jgi:hypothetical protein